MLGAERIFRPFTLERTYWSLGMVTTGTSVSGSWGGRGFSSGASGSGAGGSVPPSSSGSKAPFSLSAEGPLRQVKGSKSSAEKDRDGDRRRCDCNVSFFHIFFLLFLEKLYQKSYHFTRNKFFLFWKNPPPFYPTIPFFRPIGKYLTFVKRMIIMLDYGDLLDFVDLPCGGRFVYTRLFCNRFRADPENAIRGTLGRKSQRCAIFRQKISKTCKRKIYLSFRTKGRRCAAVFIRICA